MSTIICEFDDFSVEAEIFPGKFEKNLLQNLPLTIELTGWGNELYGSCGILFREDDLTDRLPSGAIAYTGRGNLLCFFFGQQPAWPVTVVGKLEYGSVAMLQNNPHQRAVKLMRSSA